MTYEIWNKQTPINGVEAIDIIGEEQINNDDTFVIFYNEINEVVAIESINTIKIIYSFTGLTVEDVIAEYIAMREAQ